MSAGRPTAPRRSGTTTEIAVESSATCAATGTRNLLTVRPESCDDVLMSTTTKPRPDTLIFDPATPNISARKVTDINPGDAISLEDGEFLVKSHNGYTTIGRLTGRTRHIFNVDCPTIERFEIETIADTDGVIWGVKGDRIPGTLACRPETIA